jgi:hypothetical protein
VSIANDDNCRLTLIKAWQRAQVDMAQLRKIVSGGSPATDCCEPRGPPESSQGVSRIDRKSSAKKEVLAVLC